MALGEIKLAVDNDPDGVPGVDIIYVHGLIDARGEHESEKWKTVIPELAPANSSVHEFDLKMELGDSFNAENFMRKSSELLNDVFNYHQGVKDHCRPIVFFCYSVGGMVLKRVLWNARQRFTQFNELLESICGIVFLATPHFTQESEAASRALAQILRHSSSLMPGLSHSDKALPIFLLACNLFDELKMQIPILSCYESKKTRLQDGSWLFWPWSWYHSEILVDSDLATTSAKNEQLAIIDTDLHLIFHQRETALNPSITDFLKRIIEEAPKRLRQNSKFMRKIDSMVLPTNQSPGSSGLARSSLESQLSRMVHTSSPQVSVTQKSEFHDLPVPTTPQSNEKNKDSMSNLQTVPDLSEIVAPLAPLSLPCHITGQYTCPNPHFQGGLKTFDTIDKYFQCRPGKLAEVPDGIIAFTLYGIGGQGKTQHAVSYMFSRKDCFDAVFWLQADQNGVITDPFKEIARQLGLEVSEDDPLLNKETVHSRLSQPILSHESENEKLEQKEKKVTWLMIIDNAENGACLNDCIPVNGQGYVLITKRPPIRNIPWLSPECQKYITLDRLESLEAKTLFQRLVNTKDRQDNSSEIEKVVDKLHYFPLNIVHMAGIIKYRGLSLAEFLEQYDKVDKRKELHAKKKTISTTSEHEYEKSFSSLWALEDFPRHCAQLLAFMAMLDPDRIQQDILRKIFDQVEPEESSSKYNDSIKELMERLIVSQHQDSFKLHHVVQELVREEMGQSGPVFNDAFGTAIQILSVLMPLTLFEGNGAYQQYGRMERWGQCMKILPHIESLTHTFDSLERDNMRSVATKQFSMTVIEAAMYCHERGYYSQAIELADSASQIFEFCSSSVKDTIEGKSLLATIHNVRGLTADLINDKEIALHHKQLSYKLENEVFEQTQQYTRSFAVAHSELGRVKVAFGIFDDVLELFEKSAKIRQHLSDFNPLQLYNPLRGKAMVHYHWGLQDEGQNDLLIAKKYLQQALDDREVTFGIQDKEGGRKVPPISSTSTARLTF